MAGCIATHVYQQHTAFPLAVNTQQGLPQGSPLQCTQVQTQEYAEQTVTYQQGTGHQLLVRSQPVLQTDMHTSVDDFTHASHHYCC